MEILLVTTDWTSVGGGESCMQIFSTRGGVVGPPEGEGEFGRHIVSTHGEEIFGDERASCRYGERCIISHLACRARYSLKSLKTYTPHTCSYFMVH